MTTAGTDLPGLRLDSHPRAAALARRHLRGVLGPAGLAGVEHEALLVLTELVTNAVVHAGTEVLVSLSVSSPGVLRLEVADRLPGVPPVVRAHDDSREGGRGMFLLDALAAEWGTTYRRDGKSVWCLLGGPGALVVPAEGAVAPVARNVDLAWLLELRPDLEERLPVRAVLAELLHRLCDALGVEQAAVLAPVGPDEAWRDLASRGAALDVARLQQVEQTARRANARALDVDDYVLLPLRSRSGLRGAVLLRPALPLGDAECALARVVADRMALLVAEEQLELQRQQDRGALSLLAEASDLFAGSLDVHLAAVLATQLVVPRFGTWAAMISFQDQGPRLDAVNSAAEDHIPALQDTLSSQAGTTLTAGLPRALAGLRPVPVDPGTILAGQGAHVLAVPLVARRRLIGALLVGRSTTRHTSLESGLLLDLAGRAALAADNARLYEDQSTVARALQASLLPATLPVTPDADFGATYAAAGEGNEVGGDFYDVFGLPDGAYVAAIGDVCGKGPEAAAITGLARQVLRLSLRDSRTPQQAYDRLNKAILELGDGGRFLTSALAVVRPVPAGLEVRLSCAGHPLPVLRHADGSCALVGKIGDLLGVLPSVAVPVHTLLLEPGDSLVLYTDGVTERREGVRQFGEEKLLQVLTEPSLGDATALARHVEESVRRFSRTSPRDDMAVLVIQARSHSRLVRAVAAAVD